MHNPFAIAVQWPDDHRRFLVHLQRPYFSAAIFESISAMWLAVSWSPPAARHDAPASGSIFHAAAEFCRRELAQGLVPIEFVERRHGHHLPRFLMAQAADKALFIVEPEHSSPLVEVRESERSSNSKKVNRTDRFDVITEWRLTQMRRYYQQFLERQHKLLGAATPKAKPFVTQQT
jgi:hypothetical protein